MADGKDPIDGTASIGNDYNSAEDKDKTGHDKEPNPTDGDQSKDEVNEMNESKEDAASELSSGKVSASTSSELASSNGSQGSTPKVLPITDWKINDRLDAKDYQGKWYPARVLEIDKDDNTVLIHFDGWNSRYDEWIEMLSDRLRPTPRHSDRKKKHPKNEHKVGQCVFAKWTDCRCYAARIIKINSNGTYDVLFYDGYRKTVQGINVKTMSAEVQAEYQKLGLLPPPLKKIKNQGVMSPPQQGPDVVHVKDKPRGRERKESDTKKGNVGKETSSSSATSPAEKPTKGKEVKDKPALSRVKERDRSTSSDRSSKTRDSSLDKASKTSKEPVPAAEKEKPTPKSSKVKEKTRSTSKDSSEGKTDIPEKTEKSNKGKGNESSKKKKKTAETPVATAKKRPLLVGGAFKAKKNKAESSESPSTPEIKEKSSDSKPAKRKPSIDNSNVANKKSKKMNKENAESKSDKTGCKLQKSKKEYLQAEERARDEVLGNPVVRIFELNMSPEQYKKDGKVWAPKEFKVMDDHNEFKCPYDGCQKSFRKMTLLDCHVKHYHGNNGKPVEISSRKRKKTVSVCSTDSEISVGGRSGILSRIGKRKRDSSASAASYTAEPFTPQEEVAIDLEPEEPEVVETTQDVQSIIESEEEEDRPDRLSKDEVVNCICQLNEENGLMIQCEVCLCWQHALCMELTEDSLPNKYICFICLNPPGVRESSRFSYCQDWHRDGVLPKFSFVPNHPSLALPSVVMATNDLTGDIHEINTNIHSLRIKLQALEDKENPSVQYWRRHWFHNEEPEDAEESKENQPEAPKETEQNQEPEVETHTEEVIVSSDQATGTGTSNGHDDSVKISENGIENSEHNSSGQLNGLEDNMPEKASIDDPSISNGTAEEAESERPEKSVDNQESISADAGNSSNEQVGTEAGTSLNNQNAETKEVATGTHSPVHDPVHDEPKETSSADIHDNSVDSGHTNTILDSSQGSLLSLPGQMDDDLESDEESLAPPNLSEETTLQYEHSLLLDIIQAQNNLDKQLDFVEEQVAALEQSDWNNQHGHEPSSNVPGVKRLIHQLMGDLVKVKRMARFH